MTTLAESFWCATVLRTRELSPVMRRIVLGGDGLGAYASSGAPDEWLRLMIPPRRQVCARLPERQGQSWVFGTPQPIARWYSVRRWDPASVELTIDIVLHEHGLATRWAQEVEVGDQVIVSQPHGRLAELTADWFLIIADQTGIPAACRILESLAPGQRAHAVFEAPNEAATFAPSSAGEVKVCWLYNPFPTTIASPLSAAVRTIELPPGQGFVWMAGEAACARDIRRYFRHELRWRSQHFDITGYWRPALTPAFVP